MKRVLLLLGLLLVGGCASGNKMGEVRAGWSRLGVVTPEQARQLEAAMTDQDIANMLDADVQAKLPTEVAVARLVGSSVDAIGSDELAGWTKAMAGQKQLEGVRAVSSAVVPGGSVSLHGLRTAAAQMGCELLLVYVQADGCVDNLTDAAALYWTFVGLWVAPGNVYEHKTVMQAALIDCRTGMIVGTATGEHSQKEVYAAAYEQIAHDKLDSQVPAKALENLQTNSARMFANVVAAANRKAGRADQ
jgi:hypothetical protein